MTCDNSELFLKYVQSQYKLTFNGLCILGLTQKMNTIFLVKLDFFFFINPSWLKHFESSCFVTQVLMFEQAAEQQAANFFNRMLRWKGNGCNEMILLTASLYLA